MKKNYVWIFTLEIFQNFPRSENWFFKMEKYALGPFIPLEEYVYKFSARLLKFSLKSVSSKKIISPKEYIFQKKFYSDKWVIPENCVVIKKSVSPEKRVSPDKMFHLKNLTNPKKVFKRMQHLCVDSEFSKPHF